MTSSLPQWAAIKYMTFLNDTPDFNPKLYDEWVVGNNVDLPGSYKQFLIVSKNAGSVYRQVNRVFVSDMARSVEITTLESFSEELGNPSETMRLWKGGLLPSNLFKIGSCNIKSNSYNPVLIAISGSEKGRVLIINNDATDLWHSDGANLLRRRGVVKSYASFEGFLASIEVVLW